MEHRERTQYQAMRQSGIPDLEVPAHWREKRAKRVFRERDERSATGREELLSVSHITGVTPRKDKNVTMFLAKSNVGYKKCRTADLVVNTMWAWMGALGVAKQDGIVSPAYAVYRPLDDDTLLPEYTDLLLRAPAFTAEFFRRSTGIRASRLRLYPEQFLRMPIPFPPVDEQALMLRFVGRLQGRISAYLANQQSRLALLREQRETITEDAVRAPRVSSVRLSVAADRVARTVDREADRVYLPIGLYNRGRGIFHKTPRRGDELGDSTFFWLEEGDFVLSGQFAWEGAIALAGPHEAGCVASHRFPVLRGKAGVAESAYLLSFLQTGWGQVLLDHHSRGAAGRNRPLNLRTLLKEKIAIPPLPVQKRISSLVDVELRLQYLVGVLSQLLRDYRTRLIADVVTGQVDVREAARNLPTHQGQAPGGVDLDEASESDEDIET